METDSHEDVDLGDFTSLTKADAVTIEVPFEVAGMVGETPGQRRFTFRTLGLLEVGATQSVTLARLQLSAESEIYRRKSWRGRAPKLLVPGMDASDGGGELVEYQLTVLNWSATRARGRLRVTTDTPREPGFALAFNAPDCVPAAEARCEDPAGDLRGSLVGTLQAARRTIDLAVYGLDDADVIGALCEAAKAEVRVRVISDDESLDPENTRSYSTSFEHLRECGVEVSAVQSGGLMHHKFAIIDRGLAQPVLLTGSANFTVADLQQNHNHGMVIYGAPELIDAFQAEFDQLWRHCATERLDGRTSCAECTPACVEDRSEEGPFAVGDSDVEVYFSPSDDALRVIRGQARVRTRLAAPDPACASSSANCVCRQNGTTWQCDYCAQGPDGWGLIGQARERVVLNMYSLTDQCFALGMVRAAERGAQTLAVLDFVRGGSRYSRDEYLCAAGVPTLISNWGSGSAQVRNHHKLLVVDDVVVDGSMNLSDSGITENDENTLVIRDAALADALAAYTENEAALLQRLGARFRTAAQCACGDSVDQDRDGRADATDPDCDSGVPTPTR